MLLHAVRPVGVAKLIQKDETLRPQNKYFFIISPIGLIRLIGLIGFSNWLEAEADGQIKVAVAVVEAMVSAGVPVALVIEVESIKKVAGGAYERHATVQVSGQ